MKKITFVLLFILSLCFSLTAQVQVGSGTLTNQSLPFNPGAFFSYSQSIYLASEINASGTITSIQWYYTNNNNTPSDLNNSQDLVIYIGTTSKAAFATTTDWVSVENMTQVYAGGIVTNATTGWKTITLNIPFYYNGSDNLVIAVDENYSGTDNAADKFFNTSAGTVRRSIFKTGNADIDPLAPPSGSTVTSFPSIILGGIQQGCPTPNSLVVSNVGTTSATVSWSASSHPSSGTDYYLSNTNSAPLDSTTPTGNQAEGNSLSLSSLTPATTYYVWLRSNCGSSVYSPWSASATFTTNCVPVTLLSEYFDAVTTPKLPTCWTSLKRGSGVTPSISTVVTSAAYPVSGANSLQLSNNASTGTYDIIAISPAISNLVGSNRLRFYAKGTAGTVLEIGTLDSNSNTAAFNLVEAVSNLTFNMTEYTIDFSGYSGLDQYIGFRIVGPEQSVINIDNVIWQPIPLCPDVTNIGHQNISYEGADVFWTSDGGIKQASWDIAVGLPTVSDPNTLPPSSIYHTNIDGVFTVTGLAGTTTYNYWVRSVCSGAFGTGSWVGPKQFTTTCAPVTEFNETFDSLVVPDLPSCWSKIIRPNSGVVLAGTQITTNSSIQIKSSPNCVYLKNNGSSGDFDMILVTMPISNLASGDHRLKFYGKFNSDIQVGTLNDNSATATFTLFKTVNIVQGLYEYIVDFSTYTGTDKYIGFRYPPALGAYLGVTLDNIVWEPIPACLEVSNVKALATTTTTAIIDWTDTATVAESSWEVAYGPITATNPDTLTHKTALSHPFTITELNLSTQYNVWVRANCDANGFGAWVGPILVKTECESVPSFSENFDSITSFPQTNPPTYFTDELPNCWSRILRGGPSALSIYAYVKVGYSNTKYFPGFTMNNYVQINPQGSTNIADVMLVSPNISTLGQKYRLKFDSHYPATVEVGVLDGITDSAHFTVHKTVTLPGFGGKTIVDFSDYTGVIREYNHIAIRVVNDGTFPSHNVDNIVWEPVPNCNDVSQIFVTTKSATSATLTWTPGAGNSSWQLVMTAGTESDPNTLTPVSVSYPYTVNNLTPQTVYKVWVRSLCTEGYGSWVGPYSFKTSCGAANIPYLQNFNSADSPDIPECIEAVSTAGSYWQTSYTIGGFGFNSTGMRCFPSDSDTNAWFFTQGVNLEQGQNYVLSFLKGGGCLGIGGLQACSVNNSLKVKIGNSAFPSGMTDTLVDYPSIAEQTSPSSESVSFTVPTSGVYYVGFNCYSAGGHGNLIVDDVKIESTLSMNDFDISKLNYYPNPVKDILNISFENEISSVAVLNILGQTVLTQEINKNSGSVDMSGLSKGTYLMRVNTYNQVKIIKIIKD